MDVPCYSIDANGYSFVDARMNEQRTSTTGRSDIQITGYPDARNPARCLCTSLERCSVYRLDEHHSTIHWPDRVAIVRYNSFENEKRPLFLKSVLPIPAIPGHPNATTLGPFDWMILGKRGKHCEL